MWRASSCAARLLSFCLFVLFRFFRLHLLFTRPFHAPVAGTSASRIQLCETKPISRGWAGMGEGWQGRPDCNRWAHARQTKPIPPEHTKDKHFGKESYGTLDTHKASAKQSQFPAGGHQWARACKVAQAATAKPKRAKQSQFLRSGIEAKYFGQKGLC